MPQAHAPGAEADVDFGEFQAVIAEMAAKLWMFVMRLSCSGRAFNVAFATQATTKCARPSVRLRRTRVQDRSSYRLARSVPGWACRATPC